MIDIPTIFVMTMVDKLFEEEFKGDIVSLFDIKKIFNSAIINNVANYLG